MDRSGQNCILLYGGSNRSLTEAQISETMAQFSPGDWLILQNETNLLPELVEAGFARGMQVVLNPSPYNEAITKVDLSKVKWLLVNEVEAQQCSGAEEPEQVWAYLHPRYPALSLLVTLGSGGSAAFTGTEAVRQAAFPVKAVDTTAAGDTFTGYFVAGLMEGRPLADACAGPAWRLHQRHPPRRRSLHSRKGRGGTVAPSGVLTGAAHPEIFKKRRNPAMRPIPIVIDTDPGVDDFFCLAWPVPTVTCWT